MAYRVKIHNDAAGNAEIYEVIADDGTKKQIPLRPTNAAGTTVTRGKRTLAQARLLAAAWVVEREGGGVADDVDEADELATAIESARGN